MTRPRTRGESLRFFQIRCFVLLIPSLLLAFVAASAQTDSSKTRVESPAEDSSVRRFFLGASAGLGWTFNRTSFFTYDRGDTICGFFGSAVNRFSQIELFAETPLERDSPFWLISRLRLMEMSALLTSQPLEAPRRDSIVGRDDTVRTVHEYSALLRGVGLSIGMMWEPVPRVRLTLTPGLTYLARPTPVQEEILLHPNSATWSETGSNRRRIDRNGVEFNSLMFDVGASIEARLPVSSRMVLTPAIGGNIGVTSIASNIPWHAHSFRFTLGLAYDVAPRPDPAIVDVQPIDPPIPPRVDPPRRVPRLAATVSAFSIDAQGREQPDPVIEIEEAPWVEVVPILPYVFFDSSSAAIPDRYALYGDPSGAARFSIDSLLDISPLDIHWHMLNVVGQRLRQQPRATITVTGTVSGDERSGGAERLGMERAEAVKRYLTEIWRIDPGRIEAAYAAVPEAPASEDTQEGKEENRRIEISSNNPLITEPVVIRRMATVASPPAIMFRPRIKADTAIAEWNITVYQGDKQLLSFVGSSAQRQDSTWRLADLRVNRDLRAIAYRLDVRDVTGQTVTAYDSFRVVERTRRKQVDSLGRNLELLEFNLVGFDYNSSELHPRLSERIDEIARTIDGGSQVLIIGYTDLIGDPERNRQLSLQRAQTVEGALRFSQQRLRLPTPASMAVRGYGPHERLFDNSLPEGRALSRMARVIVSRHATE